MDRHDPEATGELDLPGENENLAPHPAEADPGFDGWLGDNETSAPSKDPFAALTAPEDGDDPAAEIADWMAFTSAVADEPSVSDEVEVVIDVTDTVVSEEGTLEGEPTDSIEEGSDAGDPPFVRISDPEGDDPHEDTVELFLGDAVAEKDDGPEGAVVDDLIGADSDERDAEFEHVEEAAALGVPSDEVGQADPQRLTVLPIVSIGAAAAGSDRVPDTVSGEAADADDDTGEVPIVGFAEPDIDSEGGSTVFDMEDFTEEHYLDAATREHHDLAAAITAAEFEDTEQVALSAAIPGLESG
ncbi:MAG: hypothetical protein MUQ27_02200, partial [Acidimicrobiia bacterium]|nr:hypothetical protein [Acidimicrobiia bacterium]